MTRTTQNTAGTKTSMGWIKKISGRMLGRGQELLDDGAVIRARTDCNILWARVQDRTVHAVCVYLDPQTDIYQCTCPSSETVCEHVVAALLYASKNLPEMIRYEFNFGLAVDHLLEGITYEEARGLITRKIDDDLILYDYSAEEEEEALSAIQKIKDDIKKVDELTGQELIQLAVRRIACDISSFFRIWNITGGRDNDARAACISDIEKMFVKLHETYDTMMWASPNLDFNKFFQRARWHIRRDNYRRAASIYQGISEAIANSMDLIDDSDGYYAEKFQKAIRGMTENVNLAKLGHPRKRLYISYLHEMFIRNDPDYFNEFYDEALRAVCNTKNDLKYWRELHQPLVPDHVPDMENFSKYYWATTMISMQEHILSELHDPSLEDFYKKYYTEISDICQAYVRWLANNDPDRAHRIAKEGREIFPREKITVPDIRSKTDDP